ncbi:CDP-alcohol phosphatidyltransferase family protein [Roseovarius dicentrarchi]|uniref:CDP-alcohol phosphatidyltransferase family protein n=1 Tax=Roseovarius dicentrarchi TaxID=2250573 RepID=UPI000DEBB6A1|nr:CDP-alcohol phosphatidyltransferase family protein [Roseovarius dicentrarchi]
MADLQNRRPLSSRDTKWAARIAAWLAGRGVTPNAISQASMVAALGAGLAFAASAQAGGIAAGALLILGALACQIRLLCNLFDGMVAVEGGRSAPDGPLWNEFPDRVSDLLILAGAGVGAGYPALGLAAGALAVLTAYTRELGANTGLAPDFSGPMAKPQRMAVIIIAALIAVLEPLFAAQGTVLAAALWIIAIGAAITSIRRAARIRAALLAR